MITVSFLSSLPSSHPPPFFHFCPISRVQKYGYRPFSAENSTETLASQATEASASSIMEGEREGEVQTRPRSRAENRSVNNILHL